MSRPDGLSLLMFRVTICNLCLDGSGPECHVPGCAFWMGDVPADDVASRLMLAFVNDENAERERVAE